MRFALLASVLTAGVMWFVLGGVPVQSQSEAPTTCERCAKGGECPHCAAGQTCPHCTEGKACPYCKKGHPHRGWHGQHRWEYKCVHQTGRASQKVSEAMTAQFSGLGEQGWKLAKADNRLWCFARVQAAQ